MAEFYPEITLAAASLSVGDNVSINCPSCGRTDKMSVGKTNDGILYHCFSTNCGEKGFITDSGFQYKLEVKTRKPNAEIPRYRGTVFPAEKKDLRFFKDAFGISFAPTEVSVTDKDEYVFPIINRSGFRVGEVIRQPKWAGVPNSPRQGQPGAPKARTYIVGPRLAWYPWSVFGVNDSSTIILVEDQISAMKVRSAVECTTVALLGNTVNAEAWADILKANPMTVIWWLDKDVLANTYAQCATYGSTVEFSKVVYTEKDPKSLLVPEIREVLLD